MTKIAPTRLDAFCITWTEQADDISGVTVSTSTSFIFRIYSTSFLGHPNSTGVLLVLSGYCILWPGVHSNMEAYLCTINRYVMSRFLQREQLQRLQYLNWTLFA